nr:hypothetical protein BaRGS_029294 [Batillaria attramentaria]
MNAMFVQMVKKPEELYEAVVEVQERLVMCRSDCQLGQKKTCKVLMGTTGEQLEVWQAVDEAKLRSDLQEVYDSGIRSLAVVLMHAYT